MQYFKAIETDSMSFKFGYNFAFGKVYANARAIFWGLAYVCKEGNLWFQSIMWTIKKMSVYGSTIYWDKAKC